MEHLSHPIKDFSWKQSVSQLFGVSAKLYEKFGIPAHNGIDITGSSKSVSAVSDGILFKGSYSGFNGCALSYVRLQHKDSNISTLYLHVYPQ